VRYLGTIFDSNGLTRVIDPDERNVLVCETVSSRRYSGQSLLCNSFVGDFKQMPFSTLSHWEPAHFKDVTILVSTFR
jgi:hypothetical protein